MIQQDQTDFHFAQSNASYKMMVDPAEIRACLAGVTEAALDFETTALDPWGGEIRLTSICNDDIHILIDHQFAGPFERYVDCLHGIALYVYNGKFETLWMDFHCDNLDVPRLHIIDVDFMAKACIGGSASSLAKMAWRDMSVKMDKSWQASDWSSMHLSVGQYQYAAFDGYLTWGIKQKWEAEMTPAHWNGCHILNDATRGTLEMERTGLPLDEFYHRKQIKVWKTCRDTCESYLRRYASHEEIKNLRSRIQVGNFIKKHFPAEVVEVWPKTEKRGDLQLDRAFMTRTARVLPQPTKRWLEAYIGYTYHDKYISTYGEPLIDNYRLNGFVKARFNMAQARTGRYSSSKSNLQNIPRKVTVRTAFHVENALTQQLVLADYKGIEVRVLAELSGDKALLHDAIYGDVHTTSASVIFGIDRDVIERGLNDKGDPRHYEYKAMRSKAKGFTFQLTYGAGPDALADVLGCSFHEAVDAVTAWAEKYAKAYHYRTIMFEEMTNTKYLPVISGRKIYVFRDDRTMPVAANYPIQGAAADVMYRAIYHTYEGIRAAGLQQVVKLGATVHDELLLRSTPKAAEQALDILNEGMKRGWLDIFPGTDTNNMGDSAIGTSWAAKP